MRGIAQTDAEPESRRPDVGERHDNLTVGEIRVESGYEPTLLGKLLINQLLTKLVYLKIGHSGRVCWLLGQPLA
jgi:hypothetical protein